MIRCVAFIAIGMFLAAVPAVAETPNYVTALNGDDKRPSLQVTFHESCGEECFAASIDCDVAGGVNFTFADIEAKIAAKAMLSETRDFTVKISGVAYSFAIMKLSYGGEMYGTWLVDGQLADSQSADFRGALAKAKNFKASIGSENLMLPVTKDVKTWAAACGK